MNDQLDRQLDRQRDDAIRSATADIVAATPERAAAPAASPTWHAGHSEHGSRRWLAVAAGLLVVVGAAGLAAISGRNANTEPAAPVTVAPDGATPTGAIKDLATATEIGPDEWVVPSDLSDIGDLQFAAIEPGPANRGVHFGPTGGTARLDITIDTSSMNTTGTPVDVNGIEWKETYESGFWGAERAIGDAVVRVNSGVLDPEQGRQILADLILIPARELQSAPLDSSVLMDEQTAPVATYTVGDRTLTVRAAQQNGYYCTFTNDGNGGGGGCGQLFDPTTTWASPVLPGWGYEDNAPTLTVEASGIVAPDVATVEIDFINDTTVTVSPTDLTETFPVRFWIAGAGIKLDPGQDPSSIPNVVIEVRGLDDAGNVLYVQTPSSGTADR